MAYSAEIRYIESRLAKHPYSILIMDENGKEITSKRSLDSRAECYQIANNYHIPKSNIREVTIRNYLCE